MAETEVKEGNVLFVLCNLQYTYYLIKSWWCLRSRWNIYSV